MSYFAIVLFYLDIDECVSHSCRNGGSCIDGVNNYSCACKTGFVGYRCEVGKIDCILAKSPKSHQWDFNY